MNWAWTSTIEATPGGERSTAMRSKQTGRRRLGLIARVTPARAMSREAAQGSLLLAIAAGSSTATALRWRVAATIRLQPILLAAVEIRVQSKELIKRTARDFL